ncbi:ras protein [Mycena olivaceomarginata]|nr:ras protein [Mycena olivaceomarginata]
MCQSPTPLIVHFQTYDPTIEDAFRKHFLVDNKLCFLEVLDTAGQEDYAALHPAVRRIKRGEAIMVLVGNKSDKESEREVTKEQAFELANRLGCEIIETSARTAVNINATFAHVVRVLRAGNMKPVVQPKNQNHHSTVLDSLQQRF